MNSLIETLNHWSTGLSGFAWQMLWQSSLLIAVVFALDFALRRKVRAAVRYALWLVVLIKLIVPPTLALPTSVAWWVRSAQPPPPAMPTTHYVVSYPNSEQTEPPAEFFKNFTDDAIQPAPVLSRTGWALLASGIVSAGLLGWAIFRWRQVARLVRGASPATESLSCLLEEAGHSIGVRRRVQLLLTDQPMSPAVCGLMRPVILLPRSLAEQLPPNKLRAVLLHELSHLKRGDVWVNCLQTLLQIVYWWHPLVWLANARIRRVREEAVDDAVMLALQDDANCYAPTLLEVAKLAFHRPLASLGLVGILESRSALRQRIERLIEFTAPRRAGLSLVSILGIATFTALAVPMGEAPPRPAPETKSQSSLQTQTVASFDGILLDPQFKMVLKALQHRNDVDELTDGNIAKSLVTSVNGLPNFRPIGQLAKANGLETQTTASTDEKPEHTVQPVQLAQNSSVAVIQSPPPTAPVSPLDGALAFDKELKEATVSAGEAEAKFTFNLTNVSSFDVTITNILTSCGCTVAKMPASPWLLAPGGTGEIPVTMNLAGKSGVLTKTVSVNSDKGTKVLTVKATIRSPEETGSSNTQQTSRVIGSSVQDHSNALVDTLISRSFKVDPNTFMQAIERETGIDFSSATAAIPHIDVNGNRFVAGTTETNSMSVIQSAFIKFFRAKGVDLNPPKSFFYSDGSGRLMVRATEEDLDIIEQAIQTLNVSPPQIDIRVKFIELEENIANALSFLWNQTNRLNPLPRAGAPTAILTVPAMKDLMSALRKQPGVTELSDANVTMLSGRQAQIQMVVQIKNVVSGITNGTYQTIKTLLGPVLDVVPYVSADGYTIQMTISPSFTEFLGYDDPLKVLPNGMKSPLPHFRVRQMTTSAIVWDGQTVVLSHLPQTDVVTINGTTSTNATTEDPKRNLFVLITPTLIDPAGNRIHTDDEINSLPTAPR